MPCTPALRSHRQTSPLSLTAAPPSRKGVQNENLQLLELAAITQAPGFFSVVQNRMAWHMAFADGRGSGSVDDVCDNRLRSASRHENMEGIMVSEDNLTVTQFIDNYYRPDRLAAEPGRRERIIADREKDLRTTGRAFISRHDSVTGESVTLYDPNWRPKQYLIYLAAERGEV